jgi:iron(III) transport system substrate-binding protein
VPSAELLAAGKKKARSSFTPPPSSIPSRRWSNVFSERFPGIQIEIVRAPTGSLITRIKTEAAANRMIADVIDFTHRVQARGMVDLFAPSVGAVQRRKVDRCSLARRRG